MVTQPEIQTKERKYRRRKVNMRPYIILSIFVIPWLLLAAYPIVDSFVLSFGKWNGITKYHFTGIHNYDKLLHDHLWWHSVWLTISFSVVVVIVRTVIAILIAAVLAQRIKLYGVGFVRSLVFWPYVLPVSVVTILWSWMLNPQYGYLNELMSFVGISSVNWFGFHHILPSLEMVKIWWWLGFSVIILYAGLLEIPQEYYEAAAMDGASTLQTFFKITIPQLMPQINFLVITGIANEMKVFALPEIMTQGGPAFASYVSLIDFYSTAFGNFNLGYASTMVIVLALISGVVVLISRWVTRVLV